jgi:hypothetical protein
VGNARQRRTGVGGAAEDLACQSDDGDAQPTVWQDADDPRHRRAVEANGERSADETRGVGRFILSDRNTADKEWEFFKAASIGKSPRSPGVAQQETDNVTYRNVTGRHPKKKMRRAALAVK